MKKKSVTMILFFMCVFIFASRYTFADGKGERFSRSSDIFSSSRAPSRVTAFPNKDAFRLGPEDVIEVSVWGNKELTSEMPIRPDGLISYPLIGDIMAEGLTPAELKDKIAKALSIFITDASVTVVVKEINSIQISIAGEVNKPGTFAVNRPISLLHLFSLAEGFTEKADLKKSYLLRDGKKVSISIYKLVWEDDFSQNVQLKHNDIVSIHDNFKSHINIMGEVEKPQVITFREGMTVLDAILIAEGFTEKADLKQSYLLRHGKKVNISIHKLVREDDFSQNVRLRRNDIIHIHDNFKSHINIMGEIEKPQVITFQEGMTILDAVLMAEGLTDVARAKGTKVYRKNRKDEKFKILKVDLDKVIHDGDLSKNILLQPGDMIHVPRSFF